jgi:hypothetical protein
MMQTGYAGLSTAYVFLAVLLLLVTSAARRPWPVRAAAVVACALFFAVSWVSLPGLLGWPIQAPPPEKFRLHAAYIQQPDKASRAGGAIHLWLTDAGDFARDGTPRAYSLPYSAPLHEAVLAASARIAKGQPQMGEVTDVVDTRAMSLHDPGLVVRNTAPVRFYDIPDPLFPDK